MSHLIQLKRRIRSIKTTQKLTHAMRLISMSLYTKLEKERLAVDHYKGTVKKIFFELYKRCPRWENKLYFPDDILDATPLFIVVSSTKGFCGGLNNMLFRYLEDKLFVEEHQAAEFITIGKKATDFIEEKKLGTIIESYLDLNSNNFADIARVITKTIVEKGTYSSVSVYSSMFKNFFAQKPHKSSLIPFTKEDFKVSPSMAESDPETQPEASALYNQKEEDEVEPIWEQDKFETIDALAQRYLDTLATTILYQALISEYASRFVAMDNATTNAENYLETLTLQFNKLRQGLITREVSELSASM